MNRYVMEIRKWKKQGIGLMCAVLVLAGVMFFGLSVSAAELEPDSAADAETEAMATADGGVGGTYGGTSWKLEDGKLTVEGNGDVGLTPLGSDALWYLNLGPKTKVPPWFQYRKSITSAEIKVTGITDTSAFFVDCENLVSVDLKGLDTSNVTTMADMFYGCNQLSNLDLSGFCTENVTNMNCMFARCWELPSLDLSSFDTRNVTDMGGMFAGCRSLSALDLSGFRTENVTNMSEMLAGCAFSSLDLSNFRTSKVTSMSRMFSDCDKLSKINLSSFDTSRVIEMFNMFSGCSSLSHLDLSTFETRLVQNMSYMFEGCSSLSNLDLSGFNTSRATRMADMFSGCSSLVTLDLSSFNMAGIKPWPPDSEEGYEKWMLRGCDNLTTIYAPYNLTTVVFLPLKQNAFPIEAWYNPDGKKVSELPQNLKSSVVLRRSPVNARTISGTAVSFGDAAGETLIQLIGSNGLVINDTRVTGNDAAYKLTGVAAGDYTLRVSKENHVTRDYPVTVAQNAVSLDVALWRKGDVNGDGKVNTVDKRLLFFHLSGKLLTGYALQVGDVNGDGKINITDKRLVYYHIAGTKLLW